MSFCLSPVVFSENCSSVDVWCAHGGGECHLPLCHLVLLQVAGLVSKETYQVYLGWPQDVDFYPCLPNIKSLYRGLNWVQPVLRSVCPGHITLSRLCPLAASSSRRASGTPFQGQEWGWGAPDCPRPGHRSNGQSHLISNHLQQFYVHLRY